MQPIFDLPHNWVYRLDTTGGSGHGRLADPADPSATAHDGTRVAGTLLKRRPSSRNRLRPARARLVLFAMGRHCDWLAQAAAGGIRCSGRLWISVGHLPCLTPLHRAKRNGLWRFQVVGRVGCLVWRGRAADAPAGCFVRRHGGRRHLDPD